MRISGFQATGTAIQNPFTFYYVNNNDWSSSHSYQFWNKNFTSDPGITNAATAKTIYSPSPSGFVEPKTAAFTGFTYTGENTATISEFNTNGAFDGGWHFFSSGWKSGQTIFFAAFAYRSSNDGNIDTNVMNRQIGYFWTVGASSTIHARLISFYPLDVYPKNEHVRSEGISSFAVRE